MLNQRASHVNLLKQRGLTSSDKVTSFFRTRKSSNVPDITPVVFQSITYIGKSASLLVSQFYNYAIAVRQLTARSNGDRVASIVRCIKRNFGSFRV